MRRRLLLLVAAAVVALPFVASPGTASAISRKQHKLNVRLSGNIGQIKSRLDNLVDSITRVNNAATVLRPILTQLGGGLTQVAAGLQAAGNGLVALQGALTKVLSTTEYGVVQLVDVQTAGGTSLIPACFFTSADLPDNDNSITLSGECPLATASGTPLPAGKLGVNAGLRGNLDDGPTPYNPPAVAGITGLTVTYITGGGSVTGSLKSDSFFFCANTPNSGLQGIPGGGVPASPPTSTTQTTFPFNQISTDNMVNLLSTPVAPFNCNGTSTLPPVGSGAGPLGLQTADVTVRFTDIAPTGDMPGQ